MKQWIIASDIIYNWYSTSIADVYLANRSCHILRPVEIPHELECEIFENGVFINNKNDFLKSIVESESKFPIPLDNIKSAYDNYGQHLSSLRIADECEKVLKEDTVYFTSNITQNKYDIFIAKFKKTIPGKIVLGLKRYFDKNKTLSDVDQKNLDYANYTQEMFEKNSFSQTEVNIIISNIKCSI